MQTFILKVIMISLLLLFCNAKCIFCFSNILFNFIKVINQDLLNKKKLGLKKIK